MSRIGRRIINIPKNVIATLENNKIIIKGEQGVLEQELSNLVTVIIENNTIEIKRCNEEKVTKAYHGLIRALIQNMVIGVSELFSKTLIAEGVGYKFNIESKKIVLNIGFSHPVEFIIPTNLKVKQESPTKIIISGIDKQIVGLFASQIREKRPPEPYKGKGIHYLGEVIRRKAGKTGKTGR